MLKNIIAGLGIHIPPGAKYKRFRSTLVSGAAWTLESTDKFFLTQDPSETTGNYASKGKLVQGSKVTIFGVNFVVRQNGGTPAQLQTLLHNLVTQMTLRFRHGEELIESVAAEDCPAGGSAALNVASIATTAQEVAATSGDITTTAAVEGFNGPNDPAAALWIPGGWEVDPEKQFNVQLQGKNGSALSNATVSGLLALDTLVELKLHTIVHDGSKVSGGLPIAV